MTEPAVASAEAKRIIKLAETVIWNVGPALGLDDSDIQKIVSGQEPWQVKGLVEAAIVAAESQSSTKPTDTIPRGGEKLAARRKPA